MLTADERVRLIRLKVERAKKHIRELDRELRAFRDTDPCVVKSKPHPEWPRFIVYYLESVQAIPEGVSLIIGDVLFNLRAALDHLAYHLAIVNETTDSKVLQNTYFPISDDAAKYKTQTPGKVQGISIAAQKAIETLKPYKGGTDALWILHKLNIIDKHRVIITAASTVGFQSINSDAGLAAMVEMAKASGVRIDNPDDLVDRNIKLFLRPDDRPCPLKAGDELAIDLVDTHHRKYNDMEFRFEVSFCEPGIIESEPVLETLQHMADLVEVIVIGSKRLLV